VCERERVCVWDAAIAIPIIHICQRFVFLPIFFTYLQTLFILS
jgi:hypothetical protein